MDGSCTVLIAYSGLQYIANHGRVQGIITYTKHNATTYISWPEEEFWNGTDGIVLLLQLNLGSTAKVYICYKLL